MKALLAAVLASTWLLSIAPAGAQHAGHGASAAQDHAMNDAPAPTDPAATTTPFPEPTAEERAAAFPDLGGMRMSDHMQEDPFVSTVRADQWEASQDDAFGWNLRASAGTSFDKLLLRTEGGKDKGEQAHGNAELLWSHATGPWWDRVIGLRSDFGDGPARHWLAVGVAGLAPYRFEVEATGYVGDEGRFAARVEGEYEMLLSNRWILQPKLEANFHGKDDPANGIGTGLSEAELGLRLRYEVEPRFAPYAGYVWSRKFGGTADLARAAGRTPDEHGWVLGLRFWF